MPLSGPPLDAPFDLSKVLNRGLEAKPDELALVSAETRWTWRELEACQPKFLCSRSSGMALK